MAAKKVAIITLFATLLVAGLIAATVILIQKKNNSQTNHNNNIINSQQKSIQDLCQKTYYYQTCVETLSKATTNSSSSDNPQALIRTGFQAAMEELRHVIKQSGHETSRPYRTCQKLLEDSIRDLQKTLNRTESLYDPDFAMLIDDVKTWLTGALTYQETCLDCFEDKKNNAGDQMRRLLRVSRELTINGLALVNEFSNFQKSGPTRRLLGEIISLLPSDYIDNDNYMRDLKPKRSGWNVGFHVKTRKLLQAAPGNVEPHVVVAKDGSGKYTTINEALREVPYRSNDTFVIYIKEGVYEEYVTINQTMYSVMFLGDGPTKTRITGSRSKVGGFDTFWTATVAIEGDNFIGKDIGFENTAGPDMHQAVALRVSADMTIFYNCHIDGYQDTLYAHNHRQFYRDCHITGTIDFIFGNARAVLQNCTLLVRKPLDSQGLCMVTAQGRTAVNQTSAIVLQSCRILPAPGYPVGDGRFNTFLGRPWKEYSRTIVMDSEIEGLISPEGWATWNGTSAHLNTCWYAEVENAGPGADLTRRVTWPGIKRISVEEAEGFTPGEFMHCDAWIGGKEIPYDSGRMIRS